MCKEADLCRYNILKPINYIPSDCQTNLKIHSTMYVASPSVVPFLVRVMHYGQRFLDSFNGSVYCTYKSCVVGVKAKFREGIFLKETQHF